VPILYTGSRRRITLPELRDIPLYLRSDPATEKLLVALAMEDKTSGRYLLKVRQVRMRVMESNPAAEHFQGVQWLLSKSHPPTVDLSGCDIWYVYLSKVGLSTC
jgi:hypothetical protein